MFPQFTEDQTAIRDAARDFAMAEIDPGAAARDASGEFPREILKKLGEMGFLGMTVPEAYGGGGSDFLSYILALEQIAYADASVAVTMSVNNSVACAPILTFGTPAQKQRYLKPLASGEVLGGFMLTEPDAGSDAAALKTRATRVDGRLAAERVQGLDHQWRRGPLFRHHGAHRSRQGQEGHQRLHPRCGPTRRDHGAP